MTTENQLEATPILIALTSTGDSDEEMTMHVRGTITHQKNGWLISYTEVMEDPDSGESTSSDIKVLAREGYVTVLRAGAYGSTMVFERGRSFDSKYRTPYGEMAMSIVATQVECKLSAEAGVIHLEYQMSIGGFVSNRKMHIVWHGENPKC